MSFGSVVFSIFRKVDPVPTRRGGYGREVIGLGVTAVTGLSLLLHGPTALAAELAVDVETASKRRRASLES
jgi:hypothetical protein